MPARPLQATIAEVVFNRTVNDLYRHLALVAAPSALAAQPGRFFQLLCTGRGEGNHVLRRPMNVYRVSREEDRVGFLYKVRGAGTAGLGCGGISDVNDVVQYMLGGATAVQVGTVNFIHPARMIEIIDALPEFLCRYGLARTARLTGAVRVSEAADPRWAPVG